MKVRIGEAARARAWPRRLRQKRLAAALAVVALSAVVAVIAAGCGGGSANAGSSTANAPAGGSGNSSSSSGSSNSSASSGGEQLVNFAQCMRSHGIPDFPDPVNGQLNLRVTKGSDLDPSSPTFQAALQSCQHLLPAGQGPGSTPSPQQQTQSLKFAQCMRKHGVSNFPDPMKGHFLISGNIQQNPHFQSALQACRSILGSTLPGGSGG